MRKAASKVLTTGFGNCVERQQEARLLEKSRWWRGLLPSTFSSAEWNTCVLDKQDIATDFKTF